ncbi:aprataxin and PNK-like factor isoform X2 [Drosophila grimshawi]|uniref:aprataxin and PNK-like factor isoform X2 n=1 Tax=Drosophila grimshawi TaxID=7222 RepID=UPI000C86F970|nr:aprataxin and PNK-like factor isoform X2 [Drosophila grimshawi]
MSADEGEHLEETSGKKNDLETVTSGKRKLPDEEEANVETSESNKRRKSEDNHATTSNNNVVVKEEPTEQEPGNVETAAVEPVVVEPSSEAEPSSSSNIPIAIKTEPLTNADNDVSAAISSSGTSTSGAAVRTEPTIVVKTEPTNSNQSPAPPADCSVSSSTLRPSCHFGIRCYRQNPAHRNSEAHPGDSDYRRPSYPMPPLGTPSCPFGNSCYRRNPMHFQQYSHPPDCN